MLTIHNKGQTEALSHYTGDEVFEEVNGALTLSLTSFSVDENPGHALVEEEAIIETEDGRQFRIKQLKSTRNRKQLTAFSTFFDLKGHHKYETYGGTRTFDQFATWLFAGTGWTFESVDVDGSRLIPNYGNDNFLKLMEILLSTYECERRIMPGNHIIFEKQIGPDNDAQYRYGHNIKALSHSVDTTNLKTSIKGFGGNGLEVTYTSPNADKFPHAGEAEPVRDERFTIPESLLERIKQDIVDVPEVAIEMDALELTEKALGERVWLVYEPLGIEFQTRILAKTTRIPKERSSAVIGNAMPKTLTDQLTQQNVTIDENAKQNQTRFEQTNERITMEAERLDGEIVEAYAQIDITADSIRSEVGAVQLELEGSVADSVSFIEQTALDIQSGVDTQITYLDGRVSDAESLVTQTASSIRSEVAEDITYLDGRIDSANSSITQTARDIRSEISEEVSDINGDISSLNSSITQLSGSISSKVSASDFNALANSVDDIDYDLYNYYGDFQTEMRQTAASISSKVSMTDITGSVIASKINQSASYVQIEAQHIELDGIVRVSDSIDLGYTGNGRTKAIRFDGNNAWIYSSGDFSLTLDATRVRVEGFLSARHSSFSGMLPAIVGATTNQDLALSLTAAGRLRVYRGNGTGVEFDLDREL